MRKEDILDTSKCFLFKITFILCLLNDVFIKDFVDVSSFFLIIVPFDFNEIMQDFFATKVLDRYYQK